MQNIKLKQDKKRKKVSLVYESVVEIDEDKVEFEIGRLQVRISSMERQRDHLEEEIRKAQNELKMLQGVSLPNDTKKKETDN